MSNKELMKLTLAEASELIEKKIISPVELTRVYLDRIEETEEELNSFIKIYREEAITIAESLEKMQLAGHFLGPLHGLPMALKDNCAEKGKPNPAGSKVLENYIAQKDADVTKRLKAAGGIIIGRANMHELACGITNDNPHYGVSKNPWDKSRFTAGSSGGSGASVANGTSLCAIGTDTGSSIRTPAAINGVVGMRPTFGTVSTEGIVPLSLTFDTCGPLTRTVRDNAIMLGVLTGAEYTDLEYDAKNFRIGIMPDILFKQDEPDVIKAVKEAFEFYKSLGAEVIEFRSEHLERCKTATIINTITSVEAATWHQQLIKEHAEDYGIDCREYIQAGESLSAVAYLNAEKNRQLLKQELLEAFKTIDFFLMPTVPFTALPIGNYDLTINGKAIDFLDVSLTYTSIASISELPAISVPCGLDSKGLPIGLMLMGKPLGEAMLYRAAAAIENKVRIFEKLPAVR